MPCGPSCAEETRMDRQPPGQYGSETRVQMNANLQPEWDNPNRRVCDLFTPESIRRPDHLHQEPFPTRSERFPTRKKRFLTHCETFQMHEKSFPTRGNSFVCSHILGLIRRIRRTFVSPHVHGSGNWSHSLSLPFVALWSRNNSPRRVPCAFSKRVGTSVSGRVLEPTV